MHEPMYKKSNIGPWIFFTTLIIIAAVFALVLILKINSSTQPTSNTASNNTQALQDCIAKNVTPLQQLAGLNPNAASAAVQQSDAQTALDACKAQYPAN